MNKVNKYPDIEKLSFEKAMEELEIIVSDLENGSIELEESIEKYQRGIQNWSTSKHLGKQRWV